MFRSRFWLRVGLVVVGVGRSQHNLQRQETAHMADEGASAGKAACEPAQLGERVGKVRDNFHWRHLRGLGKLLAYGFTNRFQHARSTRWKAHRGCRRNSLPNR